MNQQDIRVSVVVTTYNWPAALGLVLKALSQQKTKYLFEVIVADDGSTEETATLIETLQKKISFPLLHVWQPDEGFRAAAIRNKAILSAQGNYIVFLDGDCVPRENFIERHGRLAEAKTFVVGNRLLLSPLITQKILSESLDCHQWSGAQWLRMRLRGQCNRLLPLASLPAWARFKTATRWKAAKGCNLAAYKEDLWAVNGWEESFSGWGYEDSDLVIRLLRSGIQSKSGRFYVPVIHLWHPENDRSKKKENWQKLMEIAKNTDRCAQQGLKQHF